MYICICGYISGSSADKDPTCQNRRCKGLRFICWVKKIPWRRKWLPTLVFLPGELHGQRSLAGYSPWGRKESATTERLNTSGSINPLELYHHHKELDYFTWFIQ